MSVNETGHYSTILELSGRRRGWKKGMQRINRYQYRLGVEKKFKHYS